MTITEESLDPDAVDTRQRLIQYIITLVYKVYVNFNARKGNDFF